MGSPFVGRVLAASEPVRQGLRHVLVRAGKSGLVGRNPGALGYKGGYRRESVLADANGRSFHRWARLVYRDQGEAPVRGRVVRFKEV